MSKQKSTKRALLSSGLVFVLCVSMLIGSTFAWFTDTAKTGVNTIQAGNLDVTLEMYEDGKWVDAEGKTLDFVKANTNTSSGSNDAAQILWEPGCSYELPHLRIRNNGNLALKYAVKITGIDGDAKLNEVIDWTISFPGHLLAQEEYKLNEGAGASLSNKTGNDGFCVLTPDASTEFVIKGHMQEAAGNAYQGLSIDGIAITVVATQAAHEYDSYDRIYDYDAPLPSIWDGTVGTVPERSNDGKRHITTAAEFAALMAVTKNENSLYSTETFVLDRDIDFANRTIVGIGGHNADVQFTFDGNQHTLSNFVINGNDEAHKELNENQEIEYRYAGLFQQFNGTVMNLTVKNATVIGNQMVGVIASNVDNKGKIIDCNVYDSTVIGAKKVGAVTGYVAGTNCTVTGCYAENVNVYASDVRTIQSAELVGYVGDGATVNNKAPKNVNVYRGVTLVSTAKELEAAVKAGGTVVLMNDIDMKNAWTTPHIANRNLTFEGNGYTIQNLNKALFNFYGGTYKISNLTVKDSDVIGDNTQLGAGVIAEQAQWANLYMDNCHVKNSTVTAGDISSAALVGYWVGGGEIKNCSVENCEVTCADSAAGVVGHRQGQSGYEAVAAVKNCTVTETKLTSNKEGAGKWRVGTVVGTVVSGTMEVSECTSVGNTLTQADTNPGHEQYGRIPAPYNGVLVLDGVTYEQQ